jgi:hypothetical protein
MKTKLLTAFFNVHFIHFANFFWILFSNRNKLHFKSHNTANQGHSEDMLDYGQLILHLMRDKQYENDNSMVFIQKI